MVRSTVVVALAAIFVAGCERPTEPKVTPTFDIAPTTSATTFSGEATVVQAQVAPPVALQPITKTLAGTGALPEEGGAKEASLLTLSITKDQTAELLALDAEIGHASTVGQGSRSDAEATVANLSVDVAGNKIEATFLQALASAVCDAVTGAIATGGSTVADLVINNAPVSVGTAPNQVVVDLPALRVVTNEQTFSGNTNKADITVNALHVTAYAVGTDLKRGAMLADVVVASAHADIRCGQCVDKGDDFTTGGGWVAGATPSPQDRKHFAVAGGFKNGLPWGHLNYSDKAAQLRVKGTEVLTYETSPSTHGDGTASVITGKGELSDGRQITYEVTVEDNGEPGDTDTFEISVFLGGALIYQYGPRPLGGGNIQFHDKPSRCP